MALTNHVGLSMLRTGITGHQFRSATVVVTFDSGFTVRHRLLKPPARRQTPPAGSGRAHGRPGYRRELCATTGGVPERVRVTWVGRCHLKSLAHAAGQSNHALGPERITP